MELCQMTLKLSHTLARLFKDLFRRCSRPTAPSPFLQTGEGQEQSILTLLIGPDAQDDYSSQYPNDLPLRTLTLGGLTLPDADHCLEQMPHLDTLILVLPRIEEEETSATVQLLRGWSGSLHILRISIRQSAFPSTPPFAAVSEQLLCLLAAINCLSQLEELLFQVEGYLLPAETGQLSLHPFTVLTVNLTHDSLIRSRD